ncbi:hypothetical protein TYRP_005244 [Tyrophagus putrescentiae]|nr:hypothetical protein TYRP_005244 [Tyrophagus putrescentiae]
MTGFTRQYWPLICRPLTLISGSDCSARHWSNSPRLTNLPSAKPLLIKGPEASKTTSTVSRLVDVKGDENLAINVKTLVGGGHVGRTLAAVDGPCRISKVVRPHAGPVVHPGLPVPESGAPGGVLISGDHVGVLHQSEIVVQIKRCGFAAGLPEDLREEHSRFDFVGDLACWQAVVEGIVLVASPHHYLKGAYLHWMQRDCQLVALYRLSHRSGNISNGRVVKDESIFECSHISVGRQCQLSRLHHLKTGKEVSQVHCSRLAQLYIFSLLEDVLQAEQKSVLLTLPLLNCHQVNVGRKLGGQPRHLGVEVLSKDRLWEVVIDDEGGDWLQEELHAQQAVIPGGRRLRSDQQNVAPSDDQPLPTDARLVERLADAKVVVVKKAPGNATDYRVVVAGNWFTDVQPPRRSVVPLSLQHLPPIGIRPKSAIVDQVRQRYPQNYLLPEAIFDVNRSDHPVQFKEICCGVNSNHQVDKRIVLKVNLRDAQVSTRFVAFGAELADRVLETLTKYVARPRGGRSTRKTNSNGHQRCDHLFPFWTGYRVENSVHIGDRQLDEVTNTLVADWVEDGDDKGASGFRCCTGRLVQLWTVNLLKDRDVG